jgi:hypothetical protein
MVDGSVKDGYVRIKLNRSSKPEDAENFINKYEDDVELLLKILEASKNDLGLKELQHHEDGPFFEVVIQFFSVAIPAVAGVITAWLKYKKGRFVQIEKNKAGKISLIGKGYSMDEINALIDKAKLDL